ncbi:MAG: ATP-binding cassette domain-containing protein [Lachnospiraceae bacterium]|nr:ATP-binding cassette domain-containing protein [Lachnospiraceae bacterium]
MYITLENIKKEYNNKNVIDGLSCAFYSGRIYVIKGVSGCGKTTLLNIISGVEANYSGDAVHSCDQTIDSIGYVFQQSMLMSSLTIMENLKLISDDEQLIEQLAKECGIEKLLSRKPEEISGGERQRCALVRVLLRHPSLLLCDEPTASVSPEDADIIARMIAGFRSENRIIIIATHTDCFDMYADDILYLDYGRISRCRHNEAPVRADQAADIGEAEIKRPLIKKTAAKTAFKRHSEAYRFITLLPLSAVFLFIFILSTLQNCSYREGIRFFASKYPTDAVYLRKEVNIPAPLKEKLIIYDNLQAEENGVRAVYLQPENASILAHGHISEGSFPKKDDEILISPQACRYYFGDIPGKECIGRTLVYCNEALYIAGITTEIRPDGGDLANDAYYYSAFRAFGRTEEPVLIFVPYDRLKRFGSISPQAEEYTYSISAVYSELLLHPDVLQALMQLNQGMPVNSVVSAAMSLQEVLDIATKILSIMLVAGMLITCFYIVLIIKGELYFRRKEAGYLQLFGLSKKDIRCLLVTEYSLRIKIAFAEAFLLYVFAAAFYLLITGDFVWGNMLYMGGMSVMIIFLYNISVWFTVNGFLKKSVKELISPYDVRS